MISELIKLAKSELMDKVSQNTPLDSQQASETIEIGGNSIFDGLKQEVMSGNVSGVMDLFSGKLDMANIMNNTIVNSIARTFILRITSQLGLPEQTATTVVNFVLPHLISFFGNKTQQNPQAIVSMVGGSVGSEAVNDIKDMLGGFFK
jgi:hypothetical protein